MGTVGPITPPFPTNDGGPSTDQQVSATYTPEGELDDRLNWAKLHVADLGKLLSQLEDASNSGGKAMAWAAKGIGWIIAQIDSWLVEYEADWYASKRLVFQKILPDSEQYHGAIFADAFQSLQDILSGLTSAGGSFGGTPLAEVAQVVFQAIVQPFSLVNNAANPQEVGSGLANQQYLLAQSLALAVGEWFIDSAANETGMGILKSLQPIMYMITNAVNPYNAVRMAMEYSYRFFIQQPLTRDINRNFPIKDLGLSALAKLYVRGAIDQGSYLDKCLDSGLDNTQAEQLIIETAKMLSISDLSKLHQMQVMSDQDVLQYLGQLGYRPGDAAAVLYLQNHARYFSIQEKIGTEAVTAWKDGKITLAQMQAIMQQMGFTADEIQIYQIEGEFSKHTSGEKPLDYTQVKDLFKKHIVDITFVTNFLTQEGYSPQNVNRLILLDFTESAQEKVKAAELLNRLAVEQQTAQLQAIEDANKNETALALAKTQLANALGAVAGTLGDLQTLPGITKLLGSGGG